MTARRLLLRWAWIAPVVLPLWLFLGYAVFEHGGWGFLGLLVVAPVAFVVLGVVSALLTARRSVRESRALAWSDAAVLLVLHGSIVGVGFFGDTAVGFAVLAVLASVGAFWWAVWRLITETSARLRSTLEEFERQARPVTPSEPPRDLGEVIVIREDGRGV